MSPGRPMWREGAEKDTNTAMKCSYFFRANARMHKQPLIWKLECLPALTSWGLEATQLLDFRAKSIKTRDFNRTSELLQRQEEQDPSALVYTEWNTMPQKLSVHSTARQANLSAFPTLAAPK